MRKQNRGSNKYTQQTKILIGTGTNNTANGGAKWMELYYLTDDLMEVNKKTPVESHWNKWLK